MNTPRILVTTAFGVSLIALTYTLTQSPAPEPQPPVVAPPSEVLSTAEALTVEPPVEETRWETYTIVSGDTVGAIFPRFSVPVRAIQDATAELYDISRIRVGRALSFRIEADSAVPAEIQYPLDEDRTLVILRDAASWSAHIHEIAYTVKEGERSLVVESSLWNAAIGAGLKAGDIISMARVLESDLDFNTEIRAGATAHMLVEELYDEQDVFTRLGAPLALIFNNAGNEYIAIRFTDEEGESRYYDLDGTSRTKAFLRSPLEFSARVTSSFDPHRFHPVLKRRRPHNGTDFGAPTGTPVRAVADAKVTRAGRAGGHGNFVKLDHPGPYESSYSHLSRIAVKNGDTVRQGQVIGYVGSTGMSTGPHLHYQFWVNGSFVDPMTIDLPRGDQLTEAEMGRFQTTRDALLERLGRDSTPSPDGAVPPAGEPVADAADE
jgi:murein DD-endopeptidase MepM/ murein hydrolase activator NlpD